MFGRFGRLGPLIVDLNLGNVAVNLGQNRSTVVLKWQHEIWHELTTGARLDCARDDAYICLKTVSFTHLKHTRYVAIPCFLNTIRLEGGVSYSELYGEL